MLIFLYGENSMLAQERLAEMRDRFVEKFDPSRLNLLELPRAANDKIIAGDAIQAMLAAPFLASKRMVILKNALDGIKKDDLDLWKNAASKIGEDSIVIFFDTKSEKQVEKHAFYKAVSGTAGVHAYPFPAFTDQAAFIWLRDRAKKLGVVISDPLLRECVALVGVDAWALASELEKLRAYANGQPVTKQMLELLVRAQFEDQMFAFIDAVADRNTKLALKMLEEQRMFGSTDTHLFVMLARQVRLLIGARSILDNHPSATKQDVANRLSIHPFVAQKVLKQAKVFSLDDLKAAHQMLFDYDIQSKSGGIDMDLAVDKVILKLVR